MTSRPSSADPRSSSSTPKWTTWRERPSNKLSSRAGSSSSSRNGTSVYYNEATKTFYPSNPIRPITPSYETKAREDPVTLATPQKLLVILDLNGTLFYRNKRNNRAVTSRPYLAPFLDFLFEHCRVMVWSSAQPHSVEAMLSFGFGNRISNLDRVWNRDHFRLPPSDYERKVLTIKDLEYVWEGIAEEKKKKDAAAHAHSKYQVEFDQTNTVLLDDSTAKIQLQPYNGVALRDFDQGLAMAGTDDELLRVRRYLEKLIYQANVSAYMRLHPYSSDAPLDNDAAKEASNTKPSKAGDALADELDDLALRLEKSTV
ncbi:HAD-like domain-containing protein [Gamsiella multidivaricata]|uniref:HAD-like domain-containing protein n=1 Tax=Gamsiella multidivaricata TaxID=101098 RepID=UPI00221E8CA7|nr:HAD-like domain-containing protein [Gamsiella multidivaricata]KAG0364671.1 hypothetical protein BGZ54_007275 [Gamsiella multidivaricata]KAI7818990.1 HAD-like domain-containing protein [Gamsiella multidivaricata]